MQIYKKLLIALMLLMLLLLFSATVQAAGTVTVSRINPTGSNNVLIVKLACTGDATDGSVPDTEITGADTMHGYWLQGFYLWEVWTVAGTGTAPDAADITVTDEIDRQLFDQDNVIAASGTTEGTISKSKIVGYKLTVSVQNQATASATWDIYLLLAR